MKIAFIVKDGLSCPVIVCPVCSKAIQNVGSGLVKWSGSEVIVCHKGVCDIRSAGGTGPDRWAWQELGAFIVYLSRGLDMVYEVESEKADMFS